MRVDQLKKSAELTNSVTATAAVKKQESALEQQHQQWSEAQAAQERWSPKEHFGHHGKVTPT